MVSTIRTNLSNGILSLNLESLQFSPLDPYLINTVSSRGGIVAFCFAVSMVCVWGGGGAGGVLESN